MLMGLYTNINILICIQGYCYAIRDFSALLPKDVDLEALGKRLCFCFLRF